MVHFALHGTKALRESNDTLAINYRRQQCRSHVRPAREGEKKVEEGESAAQDKVKRDPDGLGCLPSIIDIHQKQNMKSFTGFAMHTCRRVRCHLHWRSLKLATYALPAVQHALNLC